MTVHRRRFPGCRYGVMALRPLLRETLQPGERVLGMGAGDTGGIGWRIMALFTPLLPVGGVRTTQVIHRRRVLILTDRRLVVIPPESPQLDGTSARWNGEFPFSQMEIRRISRRRFAVLTTKTSFVVRLKGPWLGQPLPDSGDAQQAR